MLENREPQPIIALVDTQYENDDARAACLTALGWQAATALEEHTVDVHGVAAYQPGRFFERELPCLTRALALLPHEPALIIVDGYVVLDAAGTPGLGSYVFEHFGGRIPVVGIAKHAYRGSDFAVPVRRGGSLRPLFITARGISSQAAAHEVERMHGVHRIPTLCKRVDQLARGLVAPTRRSSEC